MKLKSVLDAANPNQLADALRSLGLGALLLSLVTSLKKLVPAASPYNASAYCVVLPDDAKANAVLSAYARAGAGTPGILAVVSGTPAAGQVSVAPSGDIAFAAADAWTSVDVAYAPEQYDVLELTVPVTAGTGACILPVAVTSQGFSMLLEAESLTGGLVSKMVIDPVGTATATGHARLLASKGGVSFAVADAVTKARIKLAMLPAKVPATLLEAESGIL